MKRARAPTDRIPLPILIHVDLHHMIYFSATHLTEGIDACKNNMFPPTVHWTADNKQMYVLYSADLLKHWLSYIVKSHDMWGKKTTEISKAIKPTSRGYMPNEIKSRSIQLLDDPRLVLKSMPDISDEDKHIITLTAFAIEKFLLRSSNPQLATNNVVNLGWYNTWITTNKNPMFAPSASNIAKIERLKALGYQTFNLAPHAPHRVNGPNGIYQITYDDWKNFHICEQQRFKYLKGTLGLHSITSATLKSIAPDVLHTNNVNIINYMNEQFSGLGADISNIKVSNMETVDVAALNAVYYTTKPTSTKPKISATEIAEEYYLYTRHKDKASDLKGSILTLRIHQLEWMRNMRADNPSVQFTHIRDGITDESGVPVVMTQSHNMDGHNQLQQNYNPARAIGYNNIPNSIQLGNVYNNTPPSVVPSSVSYGPQPTAKKYTTIPTVQVMPSGNNNYMTQRPMQSNSSNVSGYAPTIPSAQPAITPSKPIGSSTSYGVTPNPLSYKATSSGYSQPNPLPSAGFKYHGQPYGPIPSGHPSAQPNTQLSTKVEYTSGTTNEVRVQSTQSFQDDEYDEEYTQQAIDLSLLADADNLDVKKDTKHPIIAANKIEETEDVKADDDADVEPTD